MNKKLLLSLVCFGLALNIAGATEVAVLNIDEIVKNSVVIGKINKSLENKRTSTEKQLKSEEQKLLTEKAKLEEEIKTLSQEAAQAKIAKYQEKAVAFQDKVRKSEGMLQKGYSGALTKVTNKMKEIVAEIRKEKGSQHNFDIVVPTSVTVVYNDKVVDLSAEVLARLNKQLKDVKVEFDSIN